MGKLLNLKLTVIHLNLQYTLLVIVYKKIDMCLSIYVKIVICFNPSKWTSTRFAQVWLRGCSWPYVQSFKDSKYFLHIQSSTPMFSYHAANGNFHQQRKVTVASSSHKTIPHFNVNMWCVDVFKYFWEIHRSLLMWQTQMMLKTLTAHTIKYYIYYI